MDEQKYMARVQWLVFSGSALLLLLLAGAWIMEGTSEAWKGYQREYRKLVAKAATFRDGAGPADIEKGIFQVDLAHFDRTDRCVT
ncbi:MAG TPA: hypothetical protein ENO20_07145, partial [Bacteroides sp.]|nr:hypothetical protein [Bacteroides sp.]